MRAFAAHEGSLRLRRGNFNRAKRVGRRAFLSQVTYTGVSRGPLPLAGRKALRRLGADWHGVRPDASAVEMVYVGPPDYLVTMLATRRLTDITRRASAPSSELSEYSSEEEKLRKLYDQARAQGNRKKKKEYKEKLAELNRLHKYGSSAKQ